MTDLEAVHERYGATFATRGGRRVVDHYGRPARTHRAVRNGVGVVERALGVVVVTGDDRVQFVDDTVSNSVPREEGDGAYALLLDPEGRVETDLYVLNAGERLLLFVPPGEAGPLADDWSGKTFRQDVAIRDASDEFAVFGVHGPVATEKLAGILHGAAAPMVPLSFVRGELGDVGVTVVADDGPAGEEGYLVVTAVDAEVGGASDGLPESASTAPERVFEVLLTRGANAVPFGYRTWEALALEAGTPLFETELDGRVASDLGLENAVDYEKGCFVGQEVLSRVRNRGHPANRLVGLRPEALPERGADVLAGDEEVGEVTRAAESPTLDAPLAFALVPFDREGPLAVRVDGEQVPAERVDLPFVEGSARSARIPSYPAD